MQNRENFERCRSLAHTDALRGREEILQEFSAKAISDISPLDFLKLGSMEAGDCHRFLRSMVHDDVLPQGAVVSTSANANANATQKRSFAKSINKIGKIVRVWRGAPSTPKALLVGLFFGILGLGAAAAIAQHSHTAIATVFGAPAVPIDTSYWLSCNRLSFQSDACLYRVQHALTWTDAAAYLGMTLEDLRQFNQHLSARTKSLTLGDKLVVWRGIRNLGEVQ